MDPMVRNLGDLVRRDVPGHPLVVDHREPARPVTLTAGALRGEVAAVARGLLARGLRRGDRVAILAANRWEDLATYLGAMSAGLVAVPVNHRLPRDVVAHVLADAGVALAVADDARRALVPASLPTVGLDDDGPAGFGALRDPGAFAAVAPAPGEVAKILYTSGSMGRPKGVPLAHDGQLWALDKSVTGGDAPLHERSLVVAPTYHKNGLFFSSVLLGNGTTFHSMPRFEPRAYLELVARERLTLLSGIPTMFALMAREHDLLATLDLSSVRTLTIGSAPLTEALAARILALFPHATLSNGYGTTEAGPAVFGPHPDGRPRPPLALGVPYPDVAWRLAGGDGPNDGVLQLRTPALMAGYLHLPEVTRARLVDGWYDTGDRMRRDADGFFHFVGRDDDMFTCGGENVYPGEVEQLLERCPGVAQAAVVAVPDEVKGAIPVAFVVAAPGAAVDEAGVKAFALREGPAYAHPRFVLVVERLPVATTHKVDRAALTARARAHARAHGRH